MVYQEKRAVLSLVAIVVFFGLYVLYIFNHYQDSTQLFDNDFKFWGKAILLYIPVMIFLQIIIHIVFIIINKIVANEDPPTFADERDKLIELKAGRISHWVFILGFLVSMASQAMGMEPYFMFIVLVVASFLSPCASEIAKLVYYRRGV